ncbi:hypothetical protein D777_01969 [Marinobacter nitratireducens]|uniref:Alginate export domain-containing protein n=1 Tax=Marinobacter nitratireducens TaxID=1137280 RepID=A0A072NEY6_9GAMM|nr:hypothetical protein [Marinobacter nitratireducens]KEF31620.1 hypothetical protein D777_01969 [Marinobacter nitratireducens]
MASKALVLLSGCLALSTAYGADPIFQVQERPISETLSPETLPGAFYTFSPDEYWAEPKDSYWVNFSNWVLSQERTQGPRVQWLGQWADRTLSGSERGLPNNASYLRIGFATESEHGKPAQFEPEARFRLDIPTTRRKLRLVIESESEELIPLEERQRDRQLTEPDRTETEATGALRYLTIIGDAIDFSTDVGARLHIPPDAFVRATAQKKWRTDSHWDLIAQQRFYYYHQDGWGERSWFGAGRMAMDGWYFRSSSELEWVHRDRKFVAAQIFSLQKRVSNRSTLTPRIGVLGENKPSWRTSSAFADLTWRYRLHSDWVYGEVIPALTFPREEGFKDQTSIIFRVELYFSGSIQSSY